MKTILAIALFPSMCYCTHANIISELCFEIKMSHITSSSYSEYELQKWYEIGFREGCQRAIEIVHNDKPNEVENECRTTYFF
jgi:hypothetical protein